MERKYSGMARSKLRGTQDGTSGPPPFHGISVGIAVRDSYKLSQSATQYQKSGGFLNANKHLDYSSSGDPRSEIIPNVSSSMETLQGSSGVSSTSGDNSGLKGKMEKETGKALMFHVRSGFEPYKPNSRAVLVHGTQLKEKGTVLSSGVVSVENVSSPHLMEEVAPETKCSGQTQKFGSTSSETSSAHTDFGGTQRKGTEIAGRADAIKDAMARGLELTPLQNRAASQKLLEKQSLRDSGHAQGRGERARRGKGGRHERSGRNEEKATLTLDEWESRNAAVNSSFHRRQDISSDAALAWKLQQELNMGGLEVESRKELDEAEKIRLSMFDFSAGNRYADDSSGGRQRQRGRGRGRRRGR
eukprot:c28246_g1_i2 orf=601-1677(+)